jgi:hypothetical protein
VDSKVMQGRAPPKVPYPPFAGVDDAELSTAEPAGAELSPPHAVNVVATKIAIAVECNAFLRNDGKFFMATSDEPKRVPRWAEIAWSVQRATDNGKATPDGKWRNKLAAEIAKLPLRRIDE